MRNPVLLAAALCAACTVESPTFTPIEDSGNPPIDGSVDLDAAVDAPIDAPVIDAGPTELLLLVSDETIDVEEADTATFTVTLSAIPDGPVLVTLVSSDDDLVSVAPAFLLFSDSDWDEPQTVTLSAKEDEDIADEDITVDVASNDADNEITIAVAVSDNDDLAVVLSPADQLDVGEEANAQVGVKLSANPGVNVMVNISSDNLLAATVSSPTLNFTTSNWDVVQNLTINGIADVNTVDDTATVTFSSILTDDELLDVTVVDIDVLGITPSTTNLGTLDEGETDTFTVMLTQQPTGDVVVDVLPSDAGALAATPATLTFTTANWNQPQDVDVTAAQDVDTANESATITLHADTLTDRVVSGAVDDDDTQGIVVDPVEVTVDENGMSSFDVHLAFAPSGPLTLTVSSLNGSVAIANEVDLTFTAGNYSVNQPVAVSALDDADSINGATAIRLESLTAGLSVDVPVTVVDDDELVIVTSVPVLTVGEGSSGMFGVRLGAQPPGAVSVAVATGDAGIATAGPTPLTFNATNWDDFQLVNVSGTTDVDLEDEAVAITMSAGGMPDVDVDITVEDDDTQIVNVSAPGVTVLEGATNSTIGVTLGFQPSGSVNVTVLSNDPTAATAGPTPLTFTSGNYNQPQLINITGAQDVDTVGDSTSISLTSAGATSGSVNVTVTDDDNPVIETDVAGVTVGENGGTAQLGIRLGFQPAGPVTVTVASGAVEATVSVPSLDFTVGNYNTYQFVTITGVNDVDLTNETVTISMNATGYPQKQINATVTDDDQQAVLVAGVASTSVTITEGNSTQVAVRLAFQPAANVSVTVQSTSTAVATATPLPPSVLTFTSGNYATPQNMTITGAQDVNLVQNATTVTATAPSATTGTVNVTVNDDDTQIVVPTPGSITVLEGATNSTVGVTLGFQPSSDVTVTVLSNDLTAATVTPTPLTFTSGNYSTAQFISVTGTQDPDSVNDATTISLTAPSATGGTVNVTITDNDTPTIETDVAGVTVGENGGTAQLGIKLGAQPAGPVTVAIASGAVEATVSVPSLDFTVGNYDSFQYVTITGVNDVDLTNESVTITMTAGGYPTKQITATVNDDDQQAVLVAGAASTNVTITEGNSTQVAVRLAFQPSASVTVTVQSTNTAVATATPLPPSVLTFTVGNYATPQNLTITGAQDVNLVQNATTVTASASGATTGTVNVTVNDDDTQIVNVTTTSVTVAEGGTNTQVGVTLGFQPASDVQVTILSNDPTAATATPTPMTFTSGNYNVAQTLTIGGVQDIDATGDSTTVGLSAPSATGATVNVTVTEDDSMTIETDVAGVTVGENGGTAQLGIRLLASPGSTVQVAVSSGAVEATVGPTPLSFTVGNYNAFQYVTVTGVNDVDLTNETVTISMSASGYPLKQINATVNDDDSQGVLVAGGATANVTITEGGSTQVGVRLAFQPVGTVNVAIASTNSTVATATPAPPSVLTFNSGNYSTPQNITISGTEDVNLIANGTTVTATASGAATGTVNVTVNDNDTQQVLVENSPWDITEGTTTSVRIWLQFQPTTDTTVSFSSDDTNIAQVGPAAGLVFTPGNYSTPQFMSLHAPHDLDVVMNTTSVYATAPGAFSGYIEVNSDDDDTLQWVVAPDPIGVNEYLDANATVVLNFQPPSNLTANLAITTSGVAGVAPSSLGFTTSDWMTPKGVVVTPFVDYDTNDVATNLRVSGGAAQDGLVPLNINDLTQLFGYPTPFTGQVNTVVNAVYATPVFVSTETVMDRLAVYLLLGTGNCRIGLYTASGNAPGTLLAAPAPQPCQSGHFMIDVPDMDLAPGTYWMAFTTDVAVPIGQQTTGATIPRCSRTQSFGTALPNPWPSGCQPTQIQPTNRYIVGYEPIF